jgi:hypothetical protein
VNSVRICFTGVAPVTENHRVQHSLRGGEPEKKARGKGTEKHSLEFVGLNLQNLRFGRLDSNN